MRVEIKVPELGDSGGEEASVSFWYYDPGEKIEKDEDLVELLTDKAAFNITAPASGTLLEAGVGEGDTVKSGDLLGVMESEEPA